MHAEETSEASAATTVYAPIALGLTRAMPAAHLYPADHRRFTTLADPLLDRIRAVVQEGQALVIEIDEAGVRFDGRALDGAADGVEELRSALHELGVCCLEIESNVRLRDLHALTGRLAHGKRRLDTVGFLRDLDFEDLPASVRARRRDFGRPTAPGEPAAGSALHLGLGAGRASGASHVAHTPPRGIGVPGVNGVGGASIDPDDVGDEHPALILKDDARGAARAPAPEDQAAAATEPLEGPRADAPRLILRNPATGEQPGPAADAPPKAPVTRIEREAGALAEPLDADADEDALGALLDAWEDRDPPAGRPARGVPSPPPPPPPQPVLEHDGCQLPIAELRRQIAEAAAGGVSPASYDPDEVGEELSILFHVLLGTSDPAVRRGVGVGLHRVLSAHPLQQTGELLVVALREMLGAGDAGLVDAALPLVIAPLRRVRGMSIGGLLLELVEKGPPEAAGLLWPHIVNELLRGVQGERERPVELMHELVGRIPTKVLKAGLERLEGLEAIREESFAHALQTGPRPELGALLAELLESGRADALGTFLLQGFRGREPRRPAEVALSTFDACVPSCRRLLAALLRDVARGHETRTPDEIAGRVLLQALERTAPHRRDEAQVVRGITTLGELRHRPARAALQGVLRERRGLMRPTWPQKCRDAAQHALRTIEGKR